MRVRAKLTALPTRGTADRRSSKKMIKQIITATNIISIHHTMVKKVADGQKSDGEATEALREFVNVAKMPAPPTSSASGSNNNNTADSDSDIIGDDSPSKNTRAKKRKQDVDTSSSDEDDDDDDDNNNVDIDAEMAEWKKNKKKSKSKKTLIKSSTAEYAADLSIPIKRRLSRTRPPAKYLRPIAMMCSVMIGSESMHLFAFLWRIGCRISISTLKAP